MVQCVHIAILRYVHSHLSHGHNYNCKGHNYNCKAVSRLGWLCRNVKLTHCML